MTQQQYTPVAWQDETTSQQGTLINAERLNQMQTAHHYADGLEETDTVPTADPGVAYHKIVYCTADSTIYRWDGEAWTADIDDPTRELLEEHEADHANPHQVTKAQVGLGNADNTSDQNKPVSTAQAAAIKLVQDYLDAHEANHSNPHQVTKAQVGLGNADNTSDADKPISTATQTALNAKADKSDTYTKAQVDTALATKADKATTYTKTETDTLLGAKADQATTYTKSEVQTYVSNALDGYLPMVRTSGNQTLGGIKTTTQFWQTASEYAKGESTRHASNVLRTVDKNNSEVLRILAFFNTDGSTEPAVVYKDSNDASQTESLRYLVHKVGNESIGGDKTFAGQMLATGQRAYSAANTDDVATIGTLDQYTPMVRTTGNQTIGGTKTFTDRIQGSANYGTGGVSVSMSIGQYNTIFILPKANISSFRGVIFAVAFRRAAGTNPVFVSIAFHGTTAVGIFKWGSDTATTEFFTSEDVDNVYIGIKAKTAGLEANSIQMILLNSVGFNYTPTVNGSTGVPSDAPPGTLIAETS